jgi:hypothetical protein
MIQMIARMEMKLKIEMLETGDQNDMDFSLKRSLRKIMDDIVDMATTEDNT